MHDVFGKSRYRVSSKYLLWPIFPIFSLLKVSSYRFQGLSFSIEERQALGIHGLLPAAVKSQEEQVELCKLNVQRYDQDLNKYIYLMGLQDRNERLFYRLLQDDVKAYMPLVYTPVVGLACQKYGLIFRRPRGLFISIHDKGHVYDVIKNW